MAVMGEDWEYIKGIPINRNLEDKLIWHYDKLGIYSVKSEYKLYINNKISNASSSSSPLSRIWKNLWKLRVPSKVKHFC